MASFLSKDMLMKIALCLGVLAVLFLLMNINKGGAYSGPRMPLPPPQIEDDVVAMNDEIEDDNDLGDPLSIPVGDANGDTITLPLPPPPPQSEMIEPLAGKEMYTDFSKMDKEYSEVNFKPDLL
jgi:hypothetical protein